MSDEETRILNHKTLEQILTKLEVMDSRLQRVEGRIEERGFDTKPIWEKALTQIMEVNQAIRTLNRKIDVFSSDMLQLRADQIENDDRLRKLETDAEERGMTTVQ